MTEPRVLEPAYDFAGAAARFAEMNYGISERWLREHIGGIPHTKVGRSVRFTESQLVELLEQHTKRPGARSSGPADGRRRRV